MPIDLVKVGLAAARGLSSVCATCSRYWEARDRGLPEPQCAAQDGCGSPLRGDDFHEYSGPITDFSRWCFVCGDEARYGVRVHGRSRTVGVCSAHVNLLTQLRPVDEIDAVARELHTGAATIPVERLLATRRKTIAEAIFEVEDYYAKKRGGP